MNSEHIEKLKREYTDRYVAVDGSRPELARFKDTVGLVRTVNMSGRALVEFFEYHLNVGWYDIDVDFLKVVDKPEPKAKETAKQPAAKPAKPAAAVAEKKLSPLEMARAMDANKKADAAAPAKPSAGGGKMSTADVLAAARGGEAPAEKSKPPADAKKMSTSDILAAARADKAAPGAKAELSTAPVKPPAAPPSKVPAEKPKADRPKLATADILAMARAEKSAEPPPAAEDTAQPTVETPMESPKGQAPAKASSERVDRSKMSVDDMIAWCREHDG